MKNKLRDLIPEEPETATLQVKISKQVYKDAKKLVKSQGVRWRLFVEAAIKKFYLENK